MTNQNDVHQLFLKQLITRLNELSDSAAHMYDLNIEKYF